MMNKHLGVRYLYEGSTDGVSSLTQGGEHNVVTASASAALPGEWVANLEQAILIVDLNLIFDLIEQICPEKVARRKALNTYINNFEYDNIFSLVTASAAPNNEDESPQNRQP